MYMKLNNNLLNIKNAHSISETDVYSCNYVNNNFQLVGEVLYSNDTGTTGNVTLSKSASNYSYIEIMFKNVDACYSSVKIENPNGKVVSLTSVVSFTGGSGVNGLIAVHSRDVTISGTNISTLSSTSNGNYYGALAFWEGQNASLDKTNYIYITKVIGYK